MKITMAHGSGGNATRELVRDIFAKHFSNEYLNKMDDATLLPATSQPPALTTDSFVINPLFFPGGNIGKLAVYGTVNDLWMMGATPAYLTAGFIMEEGMDVSTLDKIVRSMAEAAAEAKVQIVAGDTKVIEGKGGLYINTAGLGYRRYGQEIGSLKARPGDRILVSGPLGNHQACIYSRRMGIENNITSDCGFLGGIVDELLRAGLGVHVLRDVTRGGLATVLNEIAEASGVSMEINQEAIPVDPDVKGLCDILGLDPLYMANEGKLVCVIEEKDAEQAMTLIKKHPHGTKAAMVGTVTPGNSQSLVTLTTKLGARRIIDVLYGEGLPRIC